MQRVFACLIATLVATLVISLPAWSAYKVVGPDGKPLRNSATAISAKPPRLNQSQNHNSPRVGPKRQGFFPVIACLLRCGHSDR